jgi:metal-responsive CopG/Arc/MetJ family transcriptional regulator
MARKTHTSTEVKNRYNAKTYKRYTVSVRKEKAEQFDHKLKEKGIENYSEIFHEAIDAFLEE